MSPVEEVRHISTKTIRPATGRHAAHEQIQLNVWDLKFLKAETIQKGLLFLVNPSIKPFKSLIDRLETSLSIALDHFYPLAGRLATTTHDDNTTISVHIDCNNAGAELIHAKANVSVSDILDPLFIPRIVHAFFPLNGTTNLDGRRNPLLAVQLTELVDGIFVGFTMNHSVVDGTSFWHFINSWSQISRTGSTHISNPPLLQPRWFPNETDHHSPIRIPINFSKEDEDQQMSKLTINGLEERMFHFSKESVARLKSKANAEQKRPINISSLQSLLAHIWRAVTRARDLGYNEETSYYIWIGNRTRLVPSLPDEYFGCAIGTGIATAKAGELLEEGLGRTATRLNQVVAAQNDVAVRGSWESWVREPAWLSTRELFSNTVATGSSPRFDVYGNDFGWGRPVAVRSGSGNKFDGKLTVFQGSAEGSVDFEACLSAPTLKAMGDDAEFMEAVSEPSPVYGF